MSQSEPPGTDGRSASIPASEILRFYNEMAAEVARLDDDLLRHGAEKIALRSESGDDAGYRRGRRDGIVGVLNELAPLLMLWSADSAGHLTPELVMNGASFVSQMEISFYRVTGELSEQSALRQALFSAVAESRPLQLLVEPAGGRERQDVTSVEVVIEAITDLGTSGRPLIANGRTTGTRQSAQVEAGDIVEVRISSQRH